MFSIDSTGAIRITKGDDSGDFNMVFYLESGMSPRKYYLETPIKIVSQPDHLFIYLDKDKFREKVKFCGSYAFEYTCPLTKEGRAVNIPAWYINYPGADVPTEVDLNDYGITFDEEELIYDRIIIDYDNDAISEVIFKIKDLYDTFDKTLIEKTFTTAEDNLLTDHGDVVLNLTAEDLEGLPAGEYRYQVYISQYNENIDGYETKAATKILPFYIL